MTRRSAAVGIGRGRRWLLGLAPALLLGATAPGVPAGGDAVGAARLDKASRLWLEGDSTLHKYKLEAKELTVRLGPGAPGTLAAFAQPDDVKSLDVEIGVAGLSSGEGGLDSNAHNALQGGKFPQIAFRMDTYRVVPGGSADKLALQIQGRLKLNGVEKPLEIDAAAQREGTAMRVTGSKELRMTDYGVKPPKFMMGMMSVSDPVTVHFDVRLDPAS